MDRPMLNCTDCMAFIPTKTTFQQMKNAKVPKVQSRIIEKKADENKCAWLWWHAAWANINAENVTQKYCYHSSFGLTDIDAQQTRNREHLLVCGAWYCSQFAQNACRFSERLHNFASVDSKQFQWIVWSANIYICCLNVTFRRIGLESLSSWAIIALCCCIINAFCQCDGNNSNNISTKI